MFFALLDTPFSPWFTMMVMSRLHSRVIGFLLIASGLVLFVETQSQEVFGNQFFLDHYHRVAAYAASLVEGQIPPRFNALGNDGYGSLEFNFVSPLRYWLGIPLLVLNIPPEYAWLVSAIGIALAAFWGTRKLTRRVLVREHQEWIAVSTGVLVLLLELAGSPLGLPMSFIPWIVYLFFIERKAAPIFRGNRVIAIIVIHSLWLLSAPQAFSLSFGLFLGFCLTQKRAAIRKLVFVYCASLACTAWFWLPAMAEKRFLSPDQTTYTVEGFQLDAAQAMFDDYPQQTVISPNAAVSLLTQSDSASKQEFTLLVPERSLLMLKRMYVPGWEVTVDGKNVPLENPLHHAGLVAFTLEAGNFHVVSKLTQHTTPRMLANTISLIALSALVGYWYSLADNLKQSAWRKSMKAKVAVTIKITQTVMKKFLPRQSR